MQRNITIELGERDATFAAESLGEHGRSLLDLVEHWRHPPVGVDWDPQERFEEGVRLCSVAIELRVALARLQAGDTISPAVDSPAESPESGSRDVPLADNGALVTHEWRVGDLVHCVTFGWTPEWRGTVQGLPAANLVRVAWGDGISTTSPSGLLEPDDGRQS